MASIQIKNKTLYVVFWYLPSMGDKKKQRWLKCSSQEQANQICNQITFWEKQSPEMLKFYAESLYPSTKQPIKRCSDRTVSSVGSEWINLLINQKIGGLSPNTLDAYDRITKKYIIPFFKNWKIDNISGAGILEFKNWLSRDEFKLSDKTVDKYVNILTLLLKYAYTAGYLTTVPQYFKDGNRKSKQIEACSQNKDHNDWDESTTISFLDLIKNDFTPETVAAELTLTCSLRVGETAGIVLKNIDREEKRILIDRELQRIKDVYISVIPHKQLYFSFPKHVLKAATTIVLMPPKNANSIRFIYPPDELWIKIDYLITKNQERKHILGPDYNPADLIFCFDDGRPMNVDYLNDKFHEIQTNYGVTKENQTCYQGLRRSSQKQKMDLSENNEKLVADMGGHTPRVLQSNYNFSTEEDKKKLMRKVSKALYKNISSIKDSN